MFFTSDLTFSVTIGGKICLEVLSFHKFLFFLGAEEKKPSRTASVVSADPLSRQNCIVFGSVAAQWLRNKIHRVILSENLCCV